MAATLTHVRALGEQIASLPACRPRAAACVALDLVLRPPGAESAGSASGVLTTAQQIGNALGVAIAGVVFFGVLGDARGARAYDRAFAIALAWTVATAAMSALMALRLAAS